MERRNVPNLIPLMQGNNDNIDVDALININMRMRAELQNYISVFANPAFREWVMLHRQNRTTEDDEGYVSGIDYF